MEFRNPISESELEALLADETTASEAFDFYFEFKQSGPMGGEYVLKPEIGIAAAPATRGFDNSMRIGLIDTLVRRANRKAKEKRDEQYDKVKDDPKRIRIVTEGDSWFQYPKFRLLRATLMKGVKETIDHLMAKDAYAIKSMDAAADLLRNMYHRGTFFDTIEEEKPAVFLLSAGGNDFFESFPYMLKAAKVSDPMENWLKPSFYTEIKALSVYYEAILLELTQRFPKLHIVVHGYDYIVPKEDGQWIGEHMIKVGLDKPEDRRRMIEFIMDVFNDNIKRIVQNPVLGNQVSYLDVRGVVPQRDDCWHDEIHPNDEGFAMVAEKFHERIQALVNPQA